MTTNILDPAALMAALPSLLPGENKTLNSPQDGIAALLHTALVTLSFRFISLDETISASGSDSNSVLPTDWNKHGPGYYSFKYKHDQSSLDFLLKVCKLGKRTVINAIALQSDKLVSLDISTEDFTSMSFYPITLAETARPLVHGFISSNRVSDLISLFKFNVITKLIPGLQKEGYRESTEPSSSSGSRPPESSSPQREPPPERDAYPYRQTRTPRSPLEVGRQDLDPFPSNPFAVPSLFPQDGDGMFVGPNHPIFGGRSGNSQPVRGPWGGDGYLPPLGAPPGARFDPIVPGGRGSRRLPHQEPDNDEFMPPGMSDSFM